MEEASDLVPNECGGRDDGGVDRISQLPDEIIVDILSLLTLKKAAATSVLSSRWLDVWKHIPHLKFDRYILPDNYIGDWDAQRCKCVEIINSVIQSHKALSLKKFKLALPLRNVAKCTVVKWLEFVFSRQVESLILNFFCQEFVLEELLRESRICLQPQTDLIFFQSLKRLCLSFLKVSGEDIELFLRDCPLLEQLTMEWLTLTSDVAVCGAKLMLKHLDIDSCGGEKYIKVSAPNLTYIKFSNEEEMKLLLENVPKLVEADFEIVRSDFASSISCYFSQLQILNLRFYNSKVLEVLANYFTQMHNLRKLVIFFQETYYHSLPPVTALIWAYPRLEEFKLMYPNRVEKFGYMQDITDIGRSPHHHLKVFELQMSFEQSMSDDFVELVTYISNNCVALRKIIIGRQFTLEDPADRYYLTRQLQGKVPNHIQLDLFN